MNHHLKVLIIEDHPFVVEAYSNVLNHLSSINTNINFSIDTASNCDDALIKLENAKSKFYDLVFLDISLPASSNGKIVSGEDLGLRIRSLSNTAKIIVCTSYTDNHRLNNILKTIDPDGFLVKEDTGFQIFLEAVQIVLNDPPYYSRTIVKLLRLGLSNKLILDNIDRQLLYQISIGTKTKDLPNILPLSITGIERRKRLLKRGLNVNSNDDFFLIKTAKDKGYI